MVRACHFLKVMRGGPIPVGLAWYEFIWKTNTWSGSYMNSQSKSRIDNPGGVRGVESILFLERRIHLTVLKSSSPMLAQTSHPPTRNLFGKTHDAGGGGATDDGVDDGILNAEDRLRESMMQVSVIRIFGCAR